MKRFSRFVTGHPIAVLVLVGLATLVALQGIVDLRTGQLRLAVDPGIDRLLPAGDEQRRFYDRARELFGGDQTLLLVLEAEDVFRPDTLAQVQRIRRVEQSCATRCSSVCSRPSRWRSAGGSSSRSAPPSAHASGW